MFDNEPRKLLQTSPVKIASELIRTSRPYEDLLAWRKAGQYHAMSEQFYKCSYSKKPDLVPQKMRKSSGGMFGRPRITSWVKDNRSVTVDSMTAMTAMKSATLATDDGMNKVHEKREQGLLLTTVSYRCINENITVDALTGPSLTHHAIVRLSQRQLAEQDTIRSTCYKALSRTRDAAALLKGHEGPYGLMLPFGSGALCVEVRDTKPTLHTECEQIRLLSVRTYLSEHMLRRDDLNRIAEIEDYYAEGDYSDLDHYREILMRNMRTPYISAWSALKEMSQAA